MKDNPMRLPMTPQSDFRTVASVGDLLASDVDSVLWVDAPEKTGRGFLQDIGRGACIYKLNNALFYPGISLQDKSVYHGVEKVGKLQDGLIFKDNPASLLLTQQMALFAESFLMSKFVPPAVGRDPSDGSFAAHLPDVSVELAGPSFFCELVTDQFGHALVDMPGRYWPLCLKTAPAFNTMRCVGLGTHGMRNGLTDAVPEFLSDMMAAYGISLSQVYLPKAPVRLKEVYVPSRIAPYNGPSGPNFVTLMQTIARHVAKDAAESLSTRIYLSRSRLGLGHRSVALDTELRVEALFANQGFEIVHPQELTFAEQIAKVRGAGWLAGLVGSQLHLAVFCTADQPKMFRICPEFFRQVTDLVVMRTLGGTLRDFVVQHTYVPPEGGQSIGPFKRNWDMTPADFDRLDKEVAQWLVE